MTQKEIMTAVGVLENASFEEILIVFRLLRQLKINRIQSAIHTVNGEREGKLK